MIGGNAYFPEFPSNELYIRWAQANVFMPAWQFGVSHLELMEYISCDIVVK